MNSPILLLEDDILNSIYRICPERLPQILEIIDQRQIKIGIDRNSERISLYARLEGRIIMTLPFLESLWYNTAFVVNIHQLVESAQKSGSGFLAYGGSIAESAFNALEKLYLDQNNPWQTGVIAPDHSEAQLITEAFLTSLAWMLHHELAHHKLGHIETSEINQQIIRKDETDADRNATDLILNKNLPLESLKKRVLGIICALLWIEENEHRQNVKLLNSTHPYFPDRLMSNLDYVWESFGSDSIIFTLPSIAIGYKEVLRYGEPVVHEENTPYRDVLKETLVAWCNRRKKIR